MSTTNSQLDLNKTKDIIFNDIFRLLDSFGLQYTQDGDNIFMKCPIHEGSDNPQGVSISLTKRAWRCWTRSCHEHYKTDIFGLIKGLLNSESFSEVLKYISKIYNLNEAKRAVNNNTNINNNSNDNNFHLLVKSIKKYQKSSDSIELCQNELKCRTNQAPSAYFISRGFSEEILGFFGVKDSLEDKGALRNRTIIPIFQHGKYAGYIARANKDWLQPKYIFSSGIKKTEYLYNYDNAITKANEKNCMFLVEGQGDVWKLWECGVQNVVGLFGKEISGTQRKMLLETGVTTLIILTDNDQAGRESKIKIKRDLGRLFKLIFPKMHTKDLGNMFTDSVKQNILKDLKGYY